MKDNCFTVLCWFLPNITRTWHFKKFICIYLAASGLSCGMQDLCCVMCNLLLWHTVMTASSVAAVSGLSCSRACGILVPWPGIELVSSALADGSLTTEPPGKSWVLSCLHFTTLLSNDHPPVNASFPWGAFWSPAASSSRQGSCSFFWEQASISGISLPVSGTVG